MIAGIVDERIERGKLREHAGVQRRLSPSGSLTSLLKVWTPGSARLAASSFSWSRPVTITVLPRW
jgi:hypothetical protein